MHLRGLEPDERLLGHAAASFRGATATSTRSTFALGSARKRADVYEIWRMQTEAGGFPTAGPEMVLGVTDSRLAVWSTTFWLSRPDTLRGSVPLTRIADLAVARHGLVTGLAIVLANGNIVEFEALRGRGIRRFADALHAALDSVQR